MSGRRAIPLLVAALVLGLPATASAAIQVNSTADPGDGLCTPEPGGCTLREAVLQAIRANGDVVNVPGGTYQLDQQQGPISLASNVTIQGAGADATVIRGAGTSPVVSVTGTGSMAGVTITGGQAALGGGIQIAGEAQLTLSDSSVSGNTASSTGAASGGGIAVGNTATLVMANTTVSGNQVRPGPNSQGFGGGIYIDGFGRAELRNSTVSSNTVDLSAAFSAGGGIVTEQDATLLMENVTVAFNTATGPAGIAQLRGSVTTVSDSIIAHNSPGEACNTVVAFQGDHNLSDDTSCRFTAPGDKQSVDPLLGPLQINTGPGRTATHALLPASPAINAGDPATCKATDQRGVPRPAGACDMGAFEYVTPTLRVVTQVVNDHGGTRDPADFSVHVTAGADVGGSPQPGSAAGTTYTLPAATYTVSAAALAKYAFTVSGDCTPAGAVTLAENEAKTCTIVANDPPPVAGKNVNAIPKSGTVRIKLPGRNRRFRKLVEGEQIPLGTTIDTRKGRVTLVAAANKTGKTATADFYRGIFKVLQTKGARPITRIVLTEKLSCGRAGKASIAAKRKKRRRLWGDGSGRFRTEGDFSSATVRGTKWLTEDTCTRTLTRVVRGKVSVRDFAKKKTVVVKAGKKYIARARR